MSKKNEKIEKAYNFFINNFNEFDLKNSNLLLEEILQVSNFSQKEANSFLIKIYKYVSSSKVNLDALNKYLKRGNK